MYNWGISVTFISKSRYSYIVRNIDKQSCMDDHQQGLDLLPDNFLYDDTNRVEETYSSNRIVYIKREDDLNYLT